MIKTWSVEHFKSIYENTELEITPLTIFTGANSSGKSTILQSMLLTTQTIQNRIYSKSVILNGHIIKLGTFDDILSYKQMTENISIGFKLDISRTRDKVPGIYRINRYLGKDGTKVQVSCDFSFSSIGKSNDITQLHPELQSSLVQMDIIKKDETVSNSIEIIKSNKSIDERKKMLQLTDTEIDEDSSLTYEVKSNFGNLTRRYPLFIEGEVVGAKLFHFLPDKVGIHFDGVVEKAKNIIGLLLNSDIHRYRYNIGDFENLNDDINEEFMKIVMGEVKSINQNLLNEAKKDYKQKRIIQLYETLASKFSFESFFAYIDALPEFYRKTFEGNVKQLENKLLESLKVNKKEKYQLELSTPPDKLDHAVRSIRRFFSSKVKYLGPLRDEPKPVYPHSGTADSMDVGFKGEHTAAVLEIHKKTIVQYLSPRDLDKGMSAGPRNVTLIDAVLDWLKYMGVVNDVKTVDRGKLGHELKVLIDKGNTFHDLTNVGVGVSQVLPILVLSLLAEKGSTLIFEQPELHLHPRVQTRLADFFVSMIQLNKQCIVESHSEYLINRLRYRAVVSPDESVTKNVIIYFVEKENEKSKYNPIRMNRYGVIEEWPKGFFDEGEENSAAILKAALEKRKKERSMKND